MQLSISTQSLHYFELQGYFEKVGFTIISDLLSFILLKHGRLGRLLDTGFLSQGSWVFKKCHQTESLYLNSTW